MNFHRKVGRTLFWGRNVVSQRLCLVVAWNRVGNKEIQISKRNLKVLGVQGVPIYYERLVVMVETCLPFPKSHQPFSHPLPLKPGKHTPHHVPPCLRFLTWKAWIQQGGKREAWDNCCQKMYGRIQLLKTKMTNWKNILMFNRKWHLHSWWIFQPVIFFGRFFQGYRGVFPAPKIGSNSSDVMKGHCSGGPRKTRCHRKVAIIPSKKGWNNPEWNPLK